MQDIIKKYIELKTAYKATRDRSFTSAKEPALQAEATRLYWEADAFTSHFIRANLENMGVKDLVVVGVLHFSDNKRIEGGIRFRDGNEAGRAEMLLSNLCGLRYRGLAKQFGVELKDVSLRIVVEQNGKVIGHIDSDGDFDYEAAPDLRTALGWKIATDGGRERLIESFNLEQEAASLLDTIRTCGVSEEAFFGGYFDTLKRVFVYKHTSRFGDGYCGAATTLWRVATRELGEEHAGYPFCY
jgi:hypothetical protein